MERRYDTGVRGELARGQGRLDRYVYGAHWGNDVTFGPAQMHDMQRQTTALSLTPGCSADRARGCDPDTALPEPQS
jgi:hypothetical protein